MYYKLAEEARRKLREGRGDTGTPPIRPEMDK